MVMMYDSGCAAERLHIKPQRVEEPPPPSQPSDIPSYQQLAHSRLSPGLARAPQSKPKPGCLDRSVFVPFASCRLGLVGGGPGCGNRKVHQPDMQICGETRMVGLASCSVDKGDTEVLPRVDPGHRGNLRPLHHMREFLFPCSRRLIQIAPRRCVQHEGSVLIK